MLKKFSTIRIIFVFTIIVLIFINSSTKIALANEETNNIEYSLEENELHIISLRTYYNKNVIMYNETRL